MSNRGDEKQKKEERIERKRKREVREASKCVVVESFGGDKGGEEPARRVRWARHGKKERAPSQQARKQQQQGQYYTNRSTHQRQGKTQEKQ